MTRYIRSTTLMLLGIALSTLAGCPSNSGPTRPGSTGSDQSADGADKQSAQPDNLDPSTPDGAVRGVIRGMSQHNLRALWDFIPASFQGDLHDLVHTFARKMDPEIWDRTVGVIRKLAVVLREKQEWMVTPESHAPQKAGAVPGKQAVVDYRAVASLLEKIADSDLGRLDKLQKTELGAWCDSVGGPLLEQFQVYAAAQPANPLAHTMTVLEDLSISTAKLAGDEATVEIAPPGESPVEVNYVRIDGRWIPKDLADGWIEAMGLAQAWLAITLAPDNLTESKPRILAGLGTLEEWLERLQQAGSKEEFDFAWSQGLQNVLTVAATFSPAMPVGDGEPSVASNAEAIPLVKVVVTGRLTAEQQDALLEKLAKQTDPAEVAPFREFSEGDASTSFTLGPVASIEDYAKKLDFLDISKVDAETRMILAVPKGQ